MTERGKSPAPPGPVTAAACRPPGRAAARMRAGRLLLLSVVR
jgi:hypothetical protein